MLSEIRQAYDSSLSDVAVALQALGLSPTTRIKTVKTLVEKLKREPARLSTIQDIAGARVVIDGDLSEQDDAAGKIQARFHPALRYYDLRPQPRYGYRAVHVVVAQHGLPVEIQIRTQLQDRWANINEKIADLFGRAIRYGQPPDQPEEPIQPGLPLTRADVVGFAAELARAIALYEEDWTSRRILIRSEISQLALPVDDEIEALGRLETELALDLRPLLTTINRVLELLGKVRPMAKPH